MQTRTDGEPSIWSAVPPQTLERLGYALFVPFVFVVVAAYVAPRFRLATAAAFVGLLAGVMVVGKVFTESIDPPWQQILTVCLWIVSLSAALVYVRKHLRVAAARSRVTGWN